MPPWYWRRGEEAPLQAAAALHPRRSGAGGGRAAAAAAAAEEAETNSRGRVINIDSPHLAHATQR